MKLRNKKTGEIKECIVIPIDSNGYPNEYEVFEKGESLAELNEDWEDYKEPKEYWVVDYLTCGVDNLAIDPKEPEVDDFNKEIGNYFETKEEAEQAVKKLKAWARLTEHGFRFDGYYLIGERYKANFVFDKEAWLTEVKPDLDLLFGVEE